MACGMSEAMVAQHILKEAEECEREYNWIGAAESYNKVSGVVSEHDPLVGEVYERLAHALYRAARQARSITQFKKNIQEAIANYGKAGEFYLRQTDSGGRGRAIRSDAMASSLRSWLASEPHERKKLLDDCRRRATEALNILEDARELWEYGRTYNLLSTPALFGLCFEQDSEVARKITTELVQEGEKAIRFLSTCGDPREQAKSYVLAATWLEQSTAYSPDLDARERCSQMTLAFWEKATELSEDTAIQQLCEWCHVDFGSDSDTALRNWTRAVEHARKTKDILLLGYALEALGYHMIYRSWATEDPDQRLDLADRALQYAQEAKLQYSLISFVSPSEASQAEYYWQLALWETDLGKRRGLLEKALEVAADEAKRAEDSGYPSTIENGHHVFSKIVSSLAKLETEPETKRRLLQTALEHRNESIRTEKRFPFAYWNQGVNHNYLADIKFELANLAKDLETRKSLLKEAIGDRETSLQLCIKQASEPPISTWHYARMGSWRYECGDWLIRLYELTGNTEDLRKSAEAFLNAAQLFEKPDQVSRIAECYWRAAQLFDRLGEHLNGSEIFIRASNHYELAEDRIPRLKSFYQDYASYMLAWSEIEKARHHHSKQDYRLAKEHYEKAAALHKATTQWDHLEANYSAWAHVEKAEDLSRREQNEEAIKAFSEASRLFREAKNSLQTELNRMESLDERQMTKSLVGAADLREEYCKARITLEEAIILDKKGDHYSSSEKYGLAASAFEAITQAMESEQDQREMRLITTLARAWQMMTRAEAEDSPSLYMEASRLFEEAKELCPNEKARFLAAGHSRFCKALEAGARYVDKRDPALHGSAIQHLESASSYYVRAGFQNASEYAKASRLLFDAYYYMDRASREKEQEMKAKLYVMAEKVLRASAESYTRAEHLEKRDQVEKLVERVKEEQQLALSLTQVLQAPSIISTTQAFTTPTPSYETPVGLERFEHADIQASLIARQRNLMVGEDLDLEIELVNSGRGAAQLIKLTEVVPEGFELTERPATCRLEDSYLNMKGKQLAPLKTEELKLVLKPRVQGSFTLKPRILYLDEGGKYKSHEPEAINITVREMGITGWLKGR